MSLYVQISRIRIVARQYCKYMSYELPEGLDLNYNTE